MKYTISNDLQVIGKVIIKENKRFSFLSYLLQGKANVLIDTLPERSADMLLDEIAAELGDKPLDAIICNHSEQDHSGALRAILQRYPDTPLYGTAACKQRLGDVLRDKDFHIVHTGDSIQVGEHSFHFIETPGLHWDDNMVTFLPQKGILFSNDLFGQSAAADPIIDASYSQDDLLKAATTYYENVFSSAPYAERTIVNTIAELPLKMIAPGHGLVLQEKWPAVLRLYQDRLPD
jgi:anaerobic nitric oxide reductase flavorubredoxin